MSHTLERLLLRPELQLVVGGTRIEVNDDTGPFCVPSPNTLVIGERILASSSGAVALRHGLELAWTCGMAPDDPVACGILSARLAGLYLVGETAAFQETRGEADPYLILLRRLSGDLPEGRTLVLLWKILCAHQPGQKTDLDQKIYDRIAAAWPVAQPAEHLIATGGDPRLRLDPGTGFKAYGCAPRPQPGVVTFSSCTASSLSERGYVAAEAARRRILAGLLGGGPDDILPAETARIRAALLEHYDVSDRAEAILAPSGTDATLLATVLASTKRHGAPTTVVVMELSETGAGIPQAALGQHFANAASLGEKACRGNPIDGFNTNLRLRTVPLRKSDGRPHTADDIEAEIARAIAEASRQGHVILHAIDLSKTGILAPRPAFLQRLAQEYGDSLDILVDGCQSRFGPNQIKAYLRYTSGVILTGSKFYTGPPFSGAILLPVNRPGPDREKIPRGLGGYSARADWADPPSATVKSANVGLILRWTAALAEMKRFNEIPINETTRILERFATRIRNAIAENPRLILFGTPLPERDENDQWDLVQTIFVFGVRDPLSPGRLLDHATLRRIQQWLYRDLSDYFPDRVAARICRIGQPVQLGAGPVAALRIAAGARIVSGEPSHVLARGETHIDREIADLNDVMAKLELILRNLPRLLLEHVPP